MKIKTGVSLFFGVLMCTVFSFTTVCWAETFYVNAANTSGLEDGSIQAPFNTIQEGLNIAGSGTVSVAPGIYHGAILLKYRVQLISEQGPELTIIDGDGAGKVVDAQTRDSSMPHIQGFTIRNGANLVYAMRRGNVAVLNMDNCILTDFTYVAILGGQYSSTNISRTLIYNLSMNPIFSQTAAFDFRWGSSYHELDNVTISNVRYAFKFYDAFAYMHNTTISNVDKVAYSYGGSVPSRLLGINNHLWNYQTLTASRYNSSPSPIVSLGTPINTDPLFMDPASGNYNLQLGSPLIDVGIDVGLPFSGVAPDIGAYEVQTSISDLAVVLEESYEDVPLAAYKNAGEQRSDALDNKLTALIRKIDEVTEDMTAEDQIAAYEQALNKLMKDIWARGDGFYGGNPKNDWITTQEEQSQLYEIVQSLQSVIQARITELQAL